MVSKAKRKDARDTPSKVITFLQWFARQQYLINQLRGRSHMMSATVAYSDISKPISDFLRQGGG